MQVTKRSAFTGITHTMDLPVTQEQLDEYSSTQSRRMIQEIFPHLSADQREFLMTGVTSEEWDAAFKDDDNVEDVHKT